MLKFDPEYQKLVQDTLKGFQESLTIPKSDVILEQDEYHDSESPNSPNPSQRQMKNIQLKLDPKATKAPEWNANLSPLIHLDELHIQRL